MFPYQITDRGVTVFIDSAPRQFAKSHSQYDLIVEAIHAGDWHSVRAHTDVAKSITLRTEGRVRIENDRIFVSDREVHGSIVERILAMISMKSEAVQGLIRFLDRTYNNCSKATVENLFDFIEACDLPITEDGCFLAYKYVKENFTDCWTGKFDNSVGAKPRMPRNECDEDRTSLCSTGLHVCSLDYLGNDYSNTNRPIIVVKVAPEDVVCVPTEHKMAKMRTEGYEVVDVLKFDDGERIKPWFDDQYDNLEVDESDSIPQVDDDGAIHGVNDEIVDAIGTPEIDIDQLISDLEEVGSNRSALQAFLDTVDGDRDALGGWVFVDGDTPETVAAVLVWIYSGNTDSSPDVEVHFDVPAAPAPAPATSDSVDARGNAKLTADQVREIKGLKKDWTDGITTLTAIGKQFGVHREQIARIFRGDTWKHINIT